MSPRVTVQPITAQFTVPLSKQAASVLEMAVMYSRCLGWRNECPIDQNSKLASWNEVGVVEVARRRTDHKRHKAERSSKNLHWMA